MQIELSDHAFIAMHDALSRRHAFFQKQPPKGPGGAMFASATHEALGSVKAACPPHLRALCGMALEPEPE